MDLKPSEQYTREGCASPSSPPPLCLSFCYDPRRFLVLQLCFPLFFLMAGTNPPMPSLPAPSLQNWLPSARSQGGYKVKMKGGPVLRLSSLAWSSFAAKIDPKHQHPLRSRLQSCSSPRALASQLQCIYLECHSYLSCLGMSSSSCIQSVWQRGKHKRLWTFDTRQKGRDRRMEVS